MCEAIKFYNMNNINTTISATQHLLEGYTHWRAFQNRLLSTFFVELLSKLLHPYSANAYRDSLYIFLMLLFLAINIVIYITLESKNGFEKLVVFLFVNFWFFICSCTIWYPWDFFEYLFFYFLFFMVSKNDRAIFHYWVLCLVWMLTKETAIFVPIVLIACLIDVREKPLMTLENRKILSSSILMFIIVFAYTYITRNILFKYSTIDGIGFDLQHGGMANFINLKRNFLGMVTYSNGLCLVPVLIYLFYIAFCFKVYQYRKSIGRKFMSLWIVVGAYLGISFVSALVIETRIFFPLSAMLVWLYFSQDIIKVGFASSVAKSS